MKKQGAIVLGSGGDCRKPGDGANGTITGAQSGLRLDVSERPPPTAHRPSSGRATAEATSEGT